MRAHQHSTGIQDQAISKSIGGNSSKIHLAVDANGNLVESIISDGTTNDVEIAPDLLALLSLEHTEVVCIDKGMILKNYESK